MKQTAVEWLVDYIKNLEKYPYKTIQELEEQAKAMEKEQIIEAHFNGCEIGEMFNNENRAFITDSEQYYNETYRQD